MEKNIVMTLSKPKINLSFRDLNYSVHYYGKEKCILKNISGIFKSGQVTAILGASGSGKTTLINILADYHEYTGSVNINNQIRDLQHFHKISRYIMQENLLLSSLTVLDMMTFAAEFKLECYLTNKEKLQVVNDILHNFNLVKSKNTLTEKLSGGERKKLTIALELINNPAVIFLDEPTSGLDEQASFQCVSILKQLAAEGRTVICSIHAPSSRTFALFDHVYIMTDGQCAYQGTGEYILPFLERIHLTCPIYYNPVDYFIDVSCGEYGDHLHELVTLTDNGKLCYPIENKNNAGAILEELHLESISEYNTSTVLQLKVLLHRALLQFYRNPTPFKFKFMMYSIMIITFSVLYYNCGNDATKIFTNVTYLYLSICALMYCALMPPLIFFPLEIKIIRSEYFNRWYNISALFLAQSIAVIPSYVIFTTLFVLITYPLTDQPLSATRMIKFIIIGVLVNMDADALSMAIGSVLNVVNSFFLGVAIMIPSVCFTIHGYGFPFRWHPLLVKLLLRTCYLRYALEALMEIIYTDRSQHLICPDSEILCPVTTTKFIPYLLGFGTVSYWLCIGVLICFYIVFKCVHYFLLRERLNPGKITKIATRICNSGMNLLCTFKDR